MYILPKTSVVSSPGQHGKEIFVFWIRQETQLHHLMKFYASSSNNHRRGHQMWLRPIKGIFAPFLLCTVVPTNMGVTWKTICHQGVQITHIPCNTLQYSYVYLTAPTSISMLWTARLTMPPFSYISILLSLGPMARKREQCIVLICLRHSTTVAVVF